MGRGDGIPSDRRRTEEYYHFSMQHRKNSDLLQRNLGELSKKATQCLYTNAYGLGNKQEELKAMVQLEIYDLT